MDAGFAARRSRRYEWMLVVVLAGAAVLRLLHWASVRTAPFVGQPVLDSAEYLRWAHEIAGGAWLGAAPFFQAPLYPYLVALVLRAGGGIDGVYLLQIAAAAGGLAAVAAAADRMLGRPHGAVAAALGALYLPAVFHDVLLLKESLATTLVALLLLALFGAREPGTPARSWLGVGIVVGLLALLRENMLLVALFVVPLTFERGAARTSLKRLSAFALGGALVLAPVAARNAALGGGFLPTTSQGGANLWIGNNPEADGTYRPLVPGKQVPAYERSESQRLAEEAAGRPLTAAEASRHWVGRVARWAWTDPLAFARLQVRKLGLYFSPYEWPDAVDYYWMKGMSSPLALPGLEWGALWLLALAGLLLARRRLAALRPVLLFEVGWLLSTVAFFLFSRYRLPAAPGLWILAAVPFVSTARAWRSGGRARAVAATLGIGLVWALPHLAGFAPRQDLVDFNRGRLAQEQGDVATARLYYERALVADPRALLPRLDLGTLAARSGDYATAARWFSEAIGVEPRSDDAHANLGATLLAQGELDAAEGELDRALALNGRNPVALQNRAVLALKRGDTAKARALLERLVALDPGQGAARALLERLDGAGPVAPRS